jgi:hypothetical protein
VEPLVSRNTANTRSSFDADYCINLVSGNPQFES